MIFKILPLFLLIIIGYIARKVDFISADIKAHLSKLVLNITLPFYIIIAMQFNFSKELLYKSGMLLVISAGFYIGSFILSDLFSKVFRLKDKKRDIFQYMLVFSNTGFMGYPLIFEIAGEQGLFYAAIFNLGFNVMTWTVGVYIMSRHENTDKTPIKEKLVHLLNPSLFAVVIGFSLFILSIRLPESLFTTFEMIGKSTTPLSMMFIGIILSESNIKSIFADILVWVISLFRLIIMPMITFVILKLLGFDDLLLLVPVILAATPAAVNGAILAGRYNNDYELASKCIFISTLLSLITIPFILYIVNMYSTI